MPTFLQAQNEIADELAQADLYPFIGKAIKAAIRCRASERFWFNESRVYTFNTVDGQEEYTFSTASGIADFIKIDYLQVQISSRWEPTRRADPTLIESLQTTTQEGQPTAWSYYGKKLRLYPTPDAIYPVRVVGHVVLTELSADGDTNDWLSGVAYDLIKAEASQIMYASYLHEFDKAAQQRQLADYFAASLHRETARRSSVGTIQAWT